MNPWEHRTSNIQHPTANQWPNWKPLVVRCWMLGVGCFPSVHRFNVRIFRGILSPSDSPLCRAVAAGGERVASSRERGILRAARVTAKKRSAGKPAAIIAILLGVFVLLQSRVPLRTAVQIGADEGFEVAKVTLCLHGHKLYSEVWNDQPPLHTWLITQLLKFESLNRSSRRESALNSAPRE